MKIKIKQLFDEITRQKVYPLTSLKAVRDPKSKKALDEMLLIGEEGVEAKEVSQRDADILGGKYRASDIDKSMTYDEDESTEVIEDVEIVDADRLGGKYTATDVDALKQRIVELETENEKLNSNLASNNLGELTNIKTYTTTDNLFTCPSDGYIALSANYGTSNYVLTTIYSADKTNNFGFGVNGHPTVNISNSIFVKKGMHVLYRGAVGLNYAVFYPLSQ